MLNEEGAAQHEKSREVGHMVQPEHAAFLRLGACACPEGDTHPLVWAL